MSLILFDLDNTLLDTGKIVNQGFKPALQAYLKSETSDLDEASQAYWQTLVDSTDFDPQAYAAFLAERYGEKTERLLELIYQPQWYTDHVFAEVPEVLSTLAKNHQLGIFSQGNAIYQQQKLQLSQLLQFFDSNLIFIFDRKIQPAILANLPSAVVIDDRLAVIETAQDFSQLRPIWLNRSGENTNENVTSIQSLSELMNKDYLN